MMVGILGTFQAKARSNTNVPIGEPPPPEADAYLAVVNATNTASSLVAHWRFNGNLTERIAARHATVGAGAQSYATSLPANTIGNAFNCAGVNWLNVTHHAALKPAVGSVMVWFKPASLHNGVILGPNAAGLTNSDFSMRTVVSGIVSCFFQTGGLSFPIATLAPYYTAGQTVNAIVTFNTAGFTMYLDGNKIDTSTDHTIGFTGNVLDWRFGWQHATDSGIFDGTIDEIAIWNRVLTRNEVYLLAQTEPT